MKKSIIWLFVSCLMVVALVLASCAPAAPEEEKPAPPAEEKPAPPKEEKPAPPKEEKPAPSPEVPRYGGAYTIPITAEPTDYDEAYFPSYLSYTLSLTNEELLIGDWTKGPAGTGEADWKVTAFFGHLSAGSLAESWDIPDPQTLIFNIRQGVYWHNKPPVNGRQLTAEDVAFTIKYIYLDNERAYNRVSAPSGLRVQSIETPDKWTVVVKVPDQAGVFLEDMGDKMHIIAPEVVEKYGNYRDWHNSVGTGPFTLVDYIPASSFTFARNPNYWDKDPIGPGKGNQLPYLDSVKWLLITDTSTRLAALRTAKIDRNTATWEEAKELKESYPQMQWVRLLDQSVAQAQIRTDVEPLSDIRVRKALAMAINRQEIKDTYYGGEAEILSWPVMAATKEFAGAYTPLEELPEEIQELFEYNPTKAKQLLAEAGYPDGFKTEILTWNTAAYVDMCTLFSAYWAEIGVDCAIDSREWGVYQSISVAKQHKQMLFRYMGGYHPQRAHQLGPGAAENFIMINDPVVNEFFDRIYANFTNYGERDKVIKELARYALAQCWYIQPPASYSYYFWWPWVKNFYGAYTPGYSNSYKEIKYTWLDQDLKEKILAGK